MQWFVADDTVTAGNASVIYGNAFTGDPAPVIISPNVESQFTAPPNLPQMMAVSLQPRSPEANTDSNSQVVLLNNSSAAINLQNSLFRNSIIISDNLRQTLVFNGESEQ